MSSAVNTSSFPPFRRFPKEIRLSIWERTIPEPRIVHIIQDAATRAMKSYTSIPAILRVNHESFSVASQIYRRAFRCSKPGQDKPDEDTSYVWFDFERDFLLIDYNMTGQLWASPEDQLANSTNPLLYTTVRWIPDDDVKRIRNLAWYSNPSHIAQNEHIWKLFTELEKWYMVTELMGSGNVVEPRNIRSSVTSLRKIAEYNLTPSYDLSFSSVWGEEHVDVQACIRLFERAKMAHRPMLGPRKLPFDSNIPLKQLRRAMKCYIDRWHSNRTPLGIHIDYRVMINPSLKNKFIEDKKRYESYILQNIEKHEEHKAEECDCEITEENWLGESRSMTGQLKWISATSVR
ncbi:uncharacterized protein EAF01_011474 [Botrytis porri]|uniref:2EXR domain-containing protein n=1 Tax=Botrytis porri TaxID=87229 RepID=A0A4Z1KQW1_9HELO|nr:uncharacterized protein EAF01_011474 [Botrytis porri]KAF7884051.1 hypothetical protein EAF01_011474 [Botrytis porri]TGO84039.1 hypothetical protein BPOR_0557g00010 [Botrytis porri]